MRRETRKRLYDIERAIGRLVEFTEGTTFADYGRDAMRQAAVERQFEIIGEAMTQLAKADATVAERISGYQRIIAFRNLLIHGYDDVDDRLVWNVVETRLPTLAREIATLLMEE